MILLKKQLRKYNLRETVQRNSSDGCSQASEKSSRILVFSPSDSSNERCNSKLPISYLGSNRKGWRKYGISESFIGVIALGPFDNQISQQPQPEVIWI